MRSEYSHTYRGRTRHGWRSVLRTDFGAYYGCHGSIRSPKCLIPLDEALEFLRGIDRGDYRIKPIGQTWDDKFAGNVEFAVEAWRLVIFNDCDSWDYIDSIVAPDGRRLEFADMYNTEIGNWYPANAVAAQFFGQDTAARYAAFEAKIAEAVRIPY